MATFAVDKGQLEAVLKAFGKSRTKDTVNVRQGLLKAAAMILERSQLYVPVDTGRLKKSGRVVDSGKEGLGAAVGVVYEAPYAIYVHEATHIKRRNGQPKFVERAVRELRGTITSMVRRQIAVGRN